MSAANYRDLPCLSCLTRGCTDAADDDHDLIITVCTDCDGDGYLTEHEAWKQRERRLDTAPLDPSSYVMEADDPTQQNNRSI